MTLEEDDFALLQDLSLSGFEDEDEVFPLLEDETFLLLLDLLRELEDFAELLLDSSRLSLRELEELVAIPDELDCTTDEDCAASEELDSSIALLSPPSGPELLASSPQATRLMHAKKANPTKNFDS